MIQYKGVDVLDIRPDGGPGRQESQVRLVDILDPVTAPAVNEARSPVAAWSGTVTISCETRAQTRAVRDFLDRRLGRLVPFWLPSMVADLTLASDVLNAASSLTIKAVGYSDTLFPPSLARRYLALYGADFLPDCYKVTAASPGSGTETLSITPGAARAYSAPATVLSFLRYCRLDEDFAEFRWENPLGPCEIAFKAVEIPNEVPS